MGGRASEGEELAAVISMFRIDPEGGLLQANATDLRPSRLVIRNFSALDLGY